MVAVLAVLAAGGAGYLAWQNKGELDRVQSELSRTESGLTQARAELKKATADLAAASKDAKDLKLATERLTAERDSVRATMESEQATGVRLRAELALAKEQISYLSARTSKDVVARMPKAATAQ